MTETSESKALEVLNAAGLTPQQAEDMEWDEFDRLDTGRPPAVRFKEHGDAVLGTVTRGYTRQKTKFGTNEPEWWDDGSPKLEPVLELLTDEGLRTLFVSSWRMQNALAAAFAEAGVRGPRKGGRLIVKYAADEPGDKGAQPAKVYEAGYDPPGGIERETPAIAGGAPEGQDEAPPF